MRMSLELEYIIVESDEEDPPAAAATVASRAAPLAPPPRAVEVPALEVIEIIAEDGVPEALARRRPTPVEALVEEVERAWEAVADAPRAAPPRQRLTMRGVRTS